MNCTENDYWQERLARKIDQKVKCLLDAEPGWQRRISALARQRALESLGLAELQAQRDKIAQEQQHLNQRRQQVDQAMQAIVRRMPLADVAPPAPQRPPLEVPQAIQTRQAWHEKELLAESERGREILRLRRERDSLPETIGLVTASPPIRAVWQQIVALLGEEPTPLQKELLGSTWPPSPPEAVPTQPEGMPTRNEKP
jgi:hypothetical protein